MSTNIGLCYMNRIKKFGLFAFFNTGFKKLTLFITLKLFLIYYNYI